MGEKKLVVLGEAERAALIKKISSNHRVDLIGDAGKLPTNPTSPQEVVRRIRRVVTEDEILAINCRKCNVFPHIGCRNKEGHTLAYEFDVSDLAFHRERVQDALTAQFNKKINAQLPLTDKWNVVYYAFILMCDSISAKSKELFGREFNSIEIQSFFAAQAVEELKADRLLDAI